METTTPKFELPEQVKAMLPMVLAQIPEETVKGLILSKVQAGLQAKVDETFAKFPEAKSLGFFVAIELEEKKVVEAQIIIGEMNEKNTAIEKPFVAFNLFEKIQSSKKEDFVKSITQ